MWFCELPSSPDRSIYASSNESDEDDVDYGAFIDRANQRKLLSQKSGKTTIALVRNHQTLGCVSQDVESPKPKFGLTNENRSILKKEW